MIKKILRTEELDNCNSEKVILMIFVVLGHALSMFTRGGGWGPSEPVQSAPVLGYIASWLGSFHIYGFTLISGYIFYYIKYEKGEYQKFLPFIKKKSERLLVPYIFIALLWVIPVYVFFYGTGNIVSKFVLCTSPSQLWFLWMLFWVFFIFWIISDFVMQHTALGILVMLLFYGVGLVLPISNYFMIKTALQYMIFFFVGFIIRQYGSNILYRIPSLIYIALDIILFAITSYFEESGGYSRLFRSVPDYSSILPER